MEKLHIENFKDYCKGYSKTDVPLNFTKPTQKLYNLLYDLQQFPHPKATREIGLSETEAKELAVKLKQREQVQKQFDVLLQSELEEYQEVLDKELQSHMSRSKENLNPRNVPLAKFGA